MNKNKTDKASFTREYRRLDWSKGKNMDRYVTSHVDRNGKECTAVRKEAYANAGSSAEKMTSHVYRWGSSN